MNIWYACSESVKPIISISVLNKLNLSALGYDGITNMYFTEITKQFVVDYFIYLIISHPWLGFFHHFMWLTLFT